MTTAILATVSAAGMIASVVFMLRARYWARYVDRLSLRIIGRVNAPRCQTVVFTWTGADQLASLGPHEFLFSPSAPVRCALHDGHSDRRHLVDPVEVRAAGFVRAPF